MAPHVVYDVRNDWRRSRWRRHLAPCRPGRDRGTRPDARCTGLLSSERAVNTGTPSEVGDRGPSRRSDGLPAGGFDRPKTCPGRQVPNAGGRPATRRAVASPRLPGTTGAACTRRQNRYARTRPRTSNDRPVVVPFRDRSADGTPVRSAVGRDGRGVRWSPTGSGGDSGDARDERRGAIAVPVSGTV